MLGDSLSISVRCVSTCTNVTVRSASPRRSAGGTSCGIGMEEDDDDENDDTGL